MIRHLLLVGAGGAIGSILRFGVQRLFLPWTATHFPFGTFLVNITGALLIGILWGIQLRNPPVDPAWNLFLMTGICGGYTTFSAFTLESVHILDNGKPVLFLMYIAGSVIAGLLATYAGIRLMR